MTDLVQATPQFGLRDEGRVYTPRPGAYAVALDAAERVLLVELDSGLFLPGGGLNDGETREQALHREVLEETGFAIAIVDEIGTARQFVTSQRERRSFNKICTFYRVELEGPAQAPSETGHRLLWLPMAEAVSRPRDGSHRWALARALEPET